MGIVNNACCCCELTTAAVLLGWLGAVGYFIVMVGLIVGISTANFSDVDDLMDVIRIAVLCSALLVSLINLVGCVCLMVGSIKKIRHLILPWLIGEIVFIVFLIFCCGAFLYEAVKLRNYMIQQFVVALCYLIFQIYVWICVYSLFQELRQQDIAKHGVETNKSTTIKDEKDGQPYSSFA